MSFIEALPGGHTRTFAGAWTASGRQPNCDVVDLLDVPEPAWAGLAERAAEPNAFFHPSWARAVARHAEGKGGARALLVWETPERQRLIAMLPVASAWDALRMPLPVLVAWQAYAPLTTPLIDRDCIDQGARGLLAAAAQDGAMALMLPSLATGGAIALALHCAARESHIKPRLLNPHHRARLDATLDATTTLGSLGTKKLKELRRQRNRLADTGKVAFISATYPDDAALALESFLALESSGWKGVRQTALGMKPGDRAFIREAIGKLSASGHAEVVTLSSGEAVVAAGVVVRHLDRAYFFKIAYDESVAKMSPGVQLTLEISRKLCANAEVEDVDSIAVENHPMINHIWRGRLAIGDLILPVRPKPSSFAAIVSLIEARLGLHNFARRAYHLVRSLKGKR